MNYIEPLQALENIDALVHYRTYKKIIVVAQKSNFPNICMKRKIVAVIRINYVTNMVRAI